MHLVFVYWIRCPYCVAMLPDLLKFLGDPAVDRSKVRVVERDDPDGLRGLPQSVLRQVRAVTSFPSIFAVTEASGVLPYEGARTRADFKKFYRRALAADASGPAAKRARTTRSPADNNRKGRAQQG